MSLDDDLSTEHPAALTTVGDRLRAEREAKGLTLDEVSQTLKISTRVLEQVEANAWGAISGYTFVRGVVRGYAKFLLLDPVPLLHDLESAPMPKPPTLDLPTSTRAALPIPGQAEGRDRLAALAGVVLVAGAVMAYFLVPDDWLGGVVSQHSSAPDRVAATASAPAPLAEPVSVPLVNSAVPAAPAVSPPATQELAPLVSHPVPVASPVVAVRPQAAVPTASSGSSALPVLPPGAATLNLRFDGKSWVEVKDRAGVMILSENVAAGNERVVSGLPPLSLALGNAEGVTVAFRGRPVDLKPHTRQKVARLALE